MQPGSSAPPLPDYEEEIEPGMEGDSPDARGNELSYVEEYGMEVEPDANEGELPKERSYSVKSNQSNSCVSEKAKKFIAENRMGPCKKQNIETSGDDRSLGKKKVLRFLLLPPLRKKQDPETLAQTLTGGGGEFCALHRREGPSGFSTAILYNQSSQEQIRKCCKPEQCLWG
jgi:hypothetical protein